MVFKFLIIWFLKFYLLSRFHLVFLPTTLTSFPPGVMLLNCSIAPRDGTTDIKKIFRKSAPERERPSRSVVLKISYLFKVARGLAFASSHLVEEEPCLGVKNVRKQTLVCSFQKERFTHLLTFSHSLTHHLITHLIL